MKWLSLFVVLLCLVVPRAVRAQMDVKTDPRIAPLLRQAANGQSDLVIFGRRPVSSMYVNMAVLNKTSKRLYWFTCYGTVYDSVQLRETEYAQIVSSAVDPFSFYKELCLENEVYLDDAVAEYRRLGKLALKDTSYNRRIVYNSASVKSAYSTLQQLMAIEGLFKKQSLKLCVFNCPSPSLLSSNGGFLLRKSLAGKVVDKSDSTIFYATSPLGLIAKISLCRQDSLKAFVYDRQNDVVDSMPLRPGKYSSLLESRDDVFLLYRGWLELQSQQVEGAIRQTLALLNRQDTGLYIRTYRMENRKQLLLAMVQFKNQRRDIERKIFSLTLPDGELVEQMLQSNYPSGATEITYLPGGLGFAYATGAKRGKKVYELTNHLGNVMSTVGDKKVSVGDRNGTIAYYNADVVNANDYYPFGSLMPGRMFSQSDKYRYGFNGKENDNEVKGDGNQQDYGMRIYDPRVGRFLSSDPLTNSYPWYTPYQFAGNKPINSIDVDGLEEYSTYDAYKTDKGTNSLAKMDGSDGAWLTSDREAKNNVWSGAMKTITQNGWTGKMHSYYLYGGKIKELNFSFGVVRDYYNWVQGNLDSKGYGSRWAMGASYLVDELANSFDNGSLTGVLYPKLGALLKDLNQGIADYAVGKFSSLLYKGGTVPASQDEWYKWDRQFIKEEQVTVAAPIVYNRWYKNDPSTLNAFNNLTQLNGLVGMGSLFMGTHYFPNFSTFNLNVNNPADQFGAQGRFDLPLLMLWPMHHAANTKTKLSPAGWKQIWQAHNSINDYHKTSM